MLSRGFLLIDDLYVDVRDARTEKAEFTRRRQRQVEDAATDERAAIVDSHHDRSAAARYPQPGAERQASMRRGRQSIVEARTRSRAAAALG
jgi:hypothetical protein